MRHLVDFLRWSVTLLSFVVSCFQVLGVAGESQAQIVLQSDSPLQMPPILGLWRTGHGGALVPLTGSTGASPSEVQASIPTDAQVTDWLAVSSLSSTWIWKPLPAPASSWGGVHADESRGEVWVASSSEPGKASVDFYDLMSVSIKSSVPCDALSRLVVDDAGAVWGIADTDGHLIQIVDGRHVPWPVHATRSQTILIGGPAEAQCAVLSDQQLDRISIVTLLRQSGAPPEVLKAVDINTEEFPQSGGLSADQRRWAFYSVLGKHLIVTDYSGREAGITSQGLALEIRPGHPDWLRLDGGRQVLAIPNQAGNSWAIAENDQRSGKFAVRPVASSTKAQGIWRGSVGEAMSSIFVSLAADGKHITVADLTAVAESYVIVPVMEITVDRTLSSIVLILNSHRVGIAALSRDRTELGWFPFQVKGLKPKH